MTPALEKELLEAEQRVKTYTLADAIREGSQETRQTVGWGDGVETACALNAAIYAASKRDLI